MSKMKMAGIAAVIIIWGIAFIRIANAEKEYRSCMASCKTDVMQLQE